MRCCASRALTPLLALATSAALGCGGSDEPDRPPVPAALRAHTATAPDGDRAAVLAAGEAAITRDARVRARRGELEHRTKRTDCKPRKGDDPRGDDVVYDCLAVTFEVKATVGAPPLASGYPFQLRVDYPEHRFGWCKIEPVGGEGARQAASKFVEPEDACGGIAD